MATVAIVGYIGAGNLGDEAVLAGTLRLLNEAGVQALVVSRAPGETEALHGVEAVHWLDAPAVRGAFQRADAVLIGGGSLLQDRTSLRSLLYYAGVSRLASRAAPAVWWAIGVGPLRGALARRAVEAAGRRAALITVRDEGSRALLTELGVPVHGLVPDPAFVLPARYAEPPRRNRLLVCPRPVPWAPGLEDWLRAELETFTARSAGEVWLVPMQRGGDEALCAALAAGLPGARLCARPDRPEDAVALFCKADAVLAVRLHAGILAALAGRPAAAVAYDPKVEAHAGMLGWPWVKPGEPLAAAIWQALAAQAPDVGLWAAKVRAVFSERVLPLVSP